MRQRDGKKEINKGKIERKRATEWRTTSKEVREKLKKEGEL